MSETPANIKKPRGRPKGSKNKVKEPEKTFLLKRGNELYLLPASVVESLSAEEAYRLGMAAYLEQRRQLMQDAISGDHYVNDIKVVDGLELSLRKLEEKIPNLVAQIDQMGLMAGTGPKPGKC